MSTPSTSSSPHPLDSAAAGGRSLLAGLAALAVAMGIGRFAFTPVLPMMLTAGAVSLAGGAWLASANYVGYLIGALLATWRPLPPPLAIRAGLLTIAVSTAAMAAPLPLLAWAALRLAAGIGSAWVLIAVSAWSMNHLQRPRSPFLAGAVFAGVGCGIAAAGLICLLLDAGGQGAAAAWLVLAFVAASLTVLVWNRFSVPGEGARSAGKLRLPVHGEALRMIASYGLFGFGYIIPATFLPLMARQALGEGVAAAWSWPVFGLAAALSVPVSAPLLHRFGARRLWLACNVVMAVAVALPLLGNSLPAIIGSALGVGGTFMVLTSAAIHQARETAGAAAPVLVAAMTASFAAGQIAGPLTIVGGAFTLPLALAALAPLLGAALLVPSGRSGAAAQAVHSTHPQERP